MIYINNYLYIILKLYKIYLINTNFFLVCDEKENRLTRDCNEAVSVVRRASY